MRFRRKSETDVDESEGTEQTPGPTAADASNGSAAPSGPYDADDRPDDGVERIDLGSLLIEPEPGRELRLQVDESTGAVQSVVLAGADGALELRAFAAPRNGDLWAEARPQIVADLESKGASATEHEGPFGPELICQRTIVRPDGGTAAQPSRIIGINGPRWMLRATLLGSPALDLDGAQSWFETLTRVGVRRGAGAMPVGEPLPVVLPANARRQS